MNNKGAEVMLKHLDYSLVDDRSIGYKFLPLNFIRWGKFQTKKVHVK